MFFSGSANGMDPGLGIVHFLMLHSNNFFHNYNIIPVHIIQGHQKQNKIEMSIKHMDNKLNIIIKVCLNVIVGCSLCSIFDFNMDIFYMCVLETI